MFIWIFYSLGIFCWALAVLYDRGCRAVMPSGWWDLTTSSPHILQCGLHLQHPGAPQLLQREG